MLRFAGTTAMKEESKATGLSWLHQAHMPSQSAGAVGAKAVAQNRFSLTTSWTGSIAAWSGRGVHGKFLAYALLRTLGLYVHDGIQVRQIFPKTVKLRAMRCLSLSGLATKQSNSVAAASG